ncbi:hypothetical protein ABVK25_000868 [Lepraria finkii]|uniref:Uncharacterized protein n=1 Tax=Lepraria finkii TaxID=1340010 RepID=A0ABR4BP62_9LECA
MVAEKLTLSVRPRGKPVKKLPEEVSLPAKGTTSELYVQLARQADTTVHRLRVTKGSDGALIPNSKDLLIEATGVREQSIIYVKDLGPQIAWRTVFLVEYAGPLLIHPLLYFMLPYTTNSPAHPTYNPSPSSSYACTLQSASSKPSSSIAFPLPQCLLSISSRIVHIIGCCQG